MGKPDMDQPLNNNFQRGPSVSLGGAKPTMSPLQPRKLGGGGVPGMDMKNFMPKPPMTGDRANAAVDLLQRPM